MDIDRIKYLANRLGEPYLFIDGKTISMTDWVRSVEQRLSASALHTEAEVPSKYDRLLDAVRHAIKELDRGQAGWAVSSRLNSIVGVLEPKETTQYAQYTCPSCNLVWGELAEGQWGCTGCGIPLVPIGDVNG